MIRVSPRSLLALLGGIGLVMQGCSTSGALKSPPGDGGAATGRFGTLSLAQQFLIDASCYDGFPMDKREPIDSTELVVRHGYVLEHSSEDKIPLWVCESVSAQQLTGHLERTNQFKADPDLLGPKAYPKDYAGSGYDRGHQAPAGNQTLDPELKDQTFYMSNMAPQRPSLNRGIWEMLESKTRAWVFHYGHAYEWTGPVRCVSKERMPSDARGECRRQTIGEHQVAVPLYFYKIILVRDQSTWKSIAFLLPNTDFKRPYHLESYITSIERIETLTGIEFMPRMSEPERRTLVTEVDAMWP
jgi:endonuclease G